MTIQQIKKLAQSGGIFCRWSSQWQEFAIFDPAHGPDSVYYTDCREDAEQTIRHLIRERNNAK